jgi:hypothetical protein
VTRAYHVSAARWPKTCAARRAALREECALRKICAQPAARAQTMRIGPAETADAAVEGRVLR